MPAKILGTSFGYTPCFDMLSLQQILNALYSGMITNAVTFAVRRILIPQGQEVKWTQMAQNMGVIKYNHNFPPPSILETPLNTQEILAGIQAIERLFGLFSSISDVQRGQLPLGKESMSGSAMMLLVNQSLQFMSGLQAAYVQWYEELFDLIIAILKERATAPMFIAVAGEGDKSILETFTNQDLPRQSRITAELGNPVMNQYAGQMQMMEMALQVGAFGAGPDAGKKLLQVMSTGSFKPLLQSANRLPELIQKENDLIKQGQVPPVSEWDRHEAHLNPEDGHPTVVEDFEARQNPMVQAALEAHIRLHEAAAAQKAAEMAGAAAQAQAAGMQATAAVLGPPPMAPTGVAPTAPGRPGPHAPPKPGRSPASAPPPNGAAGPNPRMPQLPNNPANGAPGGGP
jgi:hypothetical protein